MLNCSPSLISSMITTLIAESSMLTLDLLRWERLPESAPDPVTLNEILVGLLRRHLSMKSLLYWISPLIPQRYTLPSISTQPLWDKPQAIVLIPTPQTPPSSFPLKNSIYLKIEQESLDLCPNANVLPFPQEKILWRLDRAKVWIEPQLI